VANLLCCGFCKLPHPYSLFRAKGIPSKVAKIASLDSGQSFSQGTWSVNVGGAVYNHLARVLFNLSFNAPIKSLRFISSSIVLSNVLILLIFGNDIFLFAIELEIRRFT